MVDPTWYSRPFFVFLYNPVKKLSPGEKEPFLNDMILRYSSPHSSYSLPLFFKQHTNAIGKMYISRMNYDRTMNIMSHIH